jgi:hypothetical protein
LCYSFWPTLLATGGAAKAFGFNQSSSQRGNYVTTLTSGVRRLSRQRWICFLQPGGQTNSRISTIFLFFHLLLAVDLDALSVHIAAENSVRGAICGLIRFPNRSTDAQAVVRLLLPENAIA